ncbi:MAG: hypothetical protein ACM4D3_24710 [Candidatus Sericytochromatia bacterium]
MTAFSGKVHPAVGDEVHPRCDLRPGDEHAERQALRALAATLPGTRVVSRRPVTPSHDQ